MLVLTDADRAEAARRVPARKAWVSAAISIGSPSGVPVPCASTYVDGLGVDAGQRVRLGDDLRLPVDARRGVARP